MNGLLVTQLSTSIDMVFSSLDTDGNGFLDRDELKAGFASMVCTCSSKDWPRSYQHPRYIHGPSFADFVLHPA
jgi:uncharacterized protein (UPF0261 family)